MNRENTMRNFAIIITALLSFIIASCTLFLPDEDETPPVLVLETPEDLEIVSETVLITCTATDESGVEGTELFIDLMATGIIDTVAPYEFTWNTATFTDGIYHTIYVVGWDENGNYGNSDTASVFLDNASVHPAPADSFNVVYDPLSFKVSWRATDHVKFSSYILNRSHLSSMDSSISVYTSSNALEQSYVDIEINPLLTYYYQVLIIDSTGYLSPSEVIETPSPESFIPGGLNATAGDTTIRLRWNDNSTFETAFIIERDEGSGFSLLATIAANLTEYIDYTLEFDREYRYRIAIRYAGVDSEFSTRASANSPLKFTPTGLAATAEGNTIRLRWDDNCTFETGYLLERDDGLGYQPIAALAANVENYEDAALGYDIYYRYRVSAFKDSLQSGYSTYFYVYSPLQFAPTNLGLVSNDTSIILTWQDPCVFEEGFIIERSVGNGYVAFDSVGPNILTYTDFDIIEDEYYYYRVKAYYNETQSTYAVTAGIQSPLVFAPFSLTATGIDTSIQLRWEDRCVFEDGFILERDNGLGFTILAELGPNETGYLDSDMEYGIVYRYRVAAIDGERQSEYSWTVTRTSPLQFNPSGLAANRLESSIQLIWNDNCIFEDGYLVERNSGAGYVVISELGANQTSYEDTDMSYDILYAYRVSALSNGNQSGFSYSGSVRSPLEYAPLNLALVTTDTTIILSWEDRSDFETGFIIQRTENSTAGYVTIDSVESNVSSYADFDLHEDYYYWYRVAAYAPPADRSDFAFSAGINSPIEFTPSNMYVTSMDTAIQIRWTDNCVFEDGFILERDAGDGFSVLATLGENVTGFLDTDMQFGVVYQYRVAAFDGEYQSNYTNTLYVNSPLSFEPSALFAYVNPTSIDLTWQDNCNFEDGFKIERDEGEGFIEIASLGENISAFTDEDLMEDKTYRYRLYAYTASLQSDYTSIVAVESPIEFAPTGLSVTTQSVSIELNWVDNCIFEDGFRIERDAGSGFVQIAELDPNYTFYSDEDLAFDVLYSYRIAAFTTERQSEYTPFVTVTSPIELSPSNLTASATSAEIELNWQDNSTVEDGFRIERSDAGAAFVQINEIGADITTYTDLGLAYGVEYTYRVLAFVGTQTSDYTNEVSESVGWFETDWETVSAGTYTIGEPGSTIDHDILADYEIMRYEVTNAQYSAYLEAALVAGEIQVSEDGSAFVDGADVLYSLTLADHRIEWDGSQVSVSNGFEYFPVTGVTWDGATAFAAYYGWSLPSEFEWEVAARGNTQFDYPWGNTAPNCGLANYFGCNDGLIAVGQTSGVSPFGVYDMVGNAWEWTSSFFDGANDTYVFKGGSWGEYTDNLKTWSRFEGAPTTSYGTIGFRCIR